jgi:hypothetical protein
MNRDPWEIDLEALQTATAVIKTFILAEILDFK